MHSDAPMPPINLLVPEFILTVSLFLLHVNFSRRITMLTHSIEMHKGTYQQRDYAYHSSQQTASSPHIFA